MSGSLLEKRYACILAANCSTSFDLMLLREGLGSELQGTNRSNGTFLSEPDGTFAIEQLNKSHLLIL